MSLCMNKRVARIFHGSPSMLSPQAVSEKHERAYNAMRSQRIKMKGESLSPLCVDCMLAFLPTEDGGDVEGLLST